MTEQERGELIDTAIGRLRNYHDGEMYGCLDCYRVAPCPERELIRWYDSVRALADAPTEWRGCCDGTA